jgi:heme/copper-type cytochrome/quinol oxidase subunit 2
MNTEALFDPSKEVNLVVNVKRTMYMFIFYYQNAGHHNKRTDRLENRVRGNASENQNHIHVEVKRRL